MRKKVVIIGPESTGKSTLCRRLAAHFHTLCCPEYAREYLLEHGMYYTYDDLLTIAKGQLALEDEYVSNVQHPTSNNQNADSHSPLTTGHSLLFFDTDMYVMKIWC